jgi:hypothetical protein
MVVLRRRSSAGIDLSDGFGLLVQSHCCGTACQESAPRDPDGSGFIAISRPGVDLYFTWVDYYPLVDPNMPFLMDRNYDLRAIVESVGILCARSSLIEQDPASEPAA